MKIVFCIGFFCLISLESCSRYSDCNQIMAICQDDIAPFCLSGFDFNTNKGKFGDYTTTQISYSFNFAGNIVSTHSENSLKSQNFDVLIPCAKKEIRRALSSFEGVADINFLELEDNQQSDIRFFVADMQNKRSAVAFPNFTSNPCKDIAGNIIINSNIRNYNCELFYSLVLHEIGHALGLGHVKSKNIMNPDLNLEFHGLQSGDSLGMITIYGK